MHQDSRVSFPFRHTLAIGALSLILVLTACGGPAGTGGPPGPGPGDSDLEDSLNALGVNTAPTDRVDADQEALPESYSPLGASASFGEAEPFTDDSSSHPADELFVVGLPLPTDELTLLEKEGVQITGTGDVDPGSTSVLHSMSTADNPWVDDDSAGPANSDNSRSLRVVVAGDVDNDGYEELLAVYVDTTTADRRLALDVIEDAADGHTQETFVLADGDGILDVDAATPDLDGDGDADVVIALGRADGVDIAFLDGPSGGWSIDASRTKSIDAISGGSQMWVEMAAGNLDYDNPEELAIVVNELVDTTGNARWFAFDDGVAGLGELESGNVQGTDGGLFTAQTADVSVGDVDGDGLDEVLLGGLTELYTGCDAYRSILTVRDDAEHGLTEVDSLATGAFFANCPAFGPWRLRFMHVNAVDLDGDGIDEIQAGKHVYASLHDGMTLDDASQPAWTIPDSVFIDAGADASAYYTPNTTAIAVGDVTGDGRENIVLYHQWQEDIRIWGLSSVDTVGFAELSIVDAPWYNTQQVVRPILVPVNMDADGPSLKYSDGEYQLVFTEPIVLAAMAAAPCGEGIGQNVGACATTFGNTESTGTSGELTVSVKASAYAGVKTAANIPFVGEIGADFKETITATASLSAGQAYTVEKSQVFTSGPMEDSVVFTSVPYDRYVYTVVSHPDPDMVGGTVEVLLPREPILLKVEREFYNGHIVDNAAIGSNVFDHTPGDLATYPSTSRKNQLLSQYGGLENGPLSVGQGTGSEGLGIDVSTEVSAGGSLGIEVERSVDVTAGPALAGFSVGYGVNASLTFTSGTKTSYAVTVGDLSAATFAEHQYSFGMFTYVQSLEDQEFEVINFWVQ